jgi:glycosyltransferase involved in cell wall biosynthesis
LFLLLSGISLARSKGIRVTIEFLGASISDLKVVPEVKEILPALGEAVIGHGRIPPEQIPNRLQGASAGVVFHPKSRWADAGFPTKVPEYMALGIPVLYHPTSDLGVYIRDGIEGFAIMDYSAEGVCSGIQRLAGMPPTEVDAMRRSVRRRAVDCFDYRHYSEPLRRFLEKVR